MTELNAQHQAPAIPAKQKKASEELAAMIHNDLSQIKAAHSRASR
jgi:hypothetical protein